MLPAASHDRLRDETRCVRRPATPDSASTGQQGPATVATCALCGARYSRAGEVCAACPLHTGCDLARCPHCGFSSPARSRWADWVRRVLGIPRED